MANEQVTPQPVPMTIGVDATQDGSHVVLVFGTQQGQSVFFVSHEALAQYIDGLLQAGETCQERKAKAQLLVPATVLLDQDGKPISAAPFGLIDGEG